jgi:hypothetical protein
MLDWRDDGGEFLLASDFKWLLAGLTLPGVAVLLLYRIEK